MRIFVTGASGFVGSAVVRELLGAGHRVLGLVRSDEGAAALKAQGAEPLRGTLEELDALRSGAAAADGVIHTAFNHDFSRFADNCALDRRAIETLGETLQGSGRPLVVTSGLAHLARGRLAAETDLPPVDPQAFPRVSEATAMGFLSLGVRAMVVRLAPTTHGAGDHGFVPYLIRFAREAGFAAYVGEGQNRWSAVHRLDAAALFRLAVEGGEAGARYHAVAEEGLPFKQIAEAIGQGLGLPVRCLTREEAPTHFKWLAGFAAMDMSASSAWTRGQLGWAPTGAGLMGDLAGADYFKA
ncbi:NAD-dependent epimerase/dehydratase family protein [Hylemonella gracilis]|uniref:NAD-dependent epimerase/dehydratase family protein n=1 Tax=Hylemonella gracilis TaxID=80880 RepID=A0A4V1A1T1_9BURK|nr:SDR family oxidoreductase [Hylemonella gracilis]QBK03629.1 NAD-dependent epimerase/dehydratase family protein [Hylemonella gracilis]